MSSHQRKVAEFPLSPDRPLSIARQLDTLAQQLARVQPAALLASDLIAVRLSGCCGHFDLLNPAAAPILPSRASLDAARTQAEHPVRPDDRLVRRTGLGMLWFV